jgi:eukaryotic-like serine/threonine-protein kinase
VREAGFDSDLHAIGAQWAHLTRLEELGRAESVIYRFGDCVLDAAAYTLTRGGVVLSPQPKVFDLLRLLLERRGQVVTKAELLASLWPGEHVNKGAVPWTIFHARRVLGQGRGERGPIETIPGRGYRLIADVIVASPADPAAPLAPASPLPFVGRGEVMDRLETRLAQTQRGEGGICLLLGEAGIGKTRCAEEVRARAAQRGVRTWGGQSVEGLGAPVFWPWIEVLREAVRDLPELADSGERLLSRMTAFDARHSASDQQPPGHSDRDRFWVLDGVSRFLLEASERAPIALLLEDLHWTDSATLELLAFLAPHLQRSALLVVGTARNEAAFQDRRRAARWLRSVDRIELGHLTLDDVSLYIEALIRRTPPAPLCDAVHRASAGNPLFLQETVRSLIARHGGEKLATIEPGAIGPPAIARDVLRSRLAELDAGALSVLADASVLGERFDVPILQRLGDVPLDSLLESLEAAGRERLILSEGPHRYRFAHELLRSILYDDMSGRHRVAMHRRAAEILSELGQGRRRSQIAHHYYRSLPAGDYGRVVAAARRAAEAAERVHALEDAITFYEWALEAQALDPSAQPRERAELLCACGSAERRVGRHENARRTLSLVVEIGRQHDYCDLLLRAARTLRPTHAVSGLPDPIARAALEEVLRVSPEGPDPQRISALSQLACVPPYAHDMARSALLSEEAVRLARKHGDSGQLFEALRARLHSLSGPDHLDDVIAVADEMLALNERGGWTTGDAHMARLGAFLYRGDRAAADAELLAVERDARAARLPEAIWMYDRICNQRRVLDGEFEAAEKGCADLSSRAKRMRLGYGRVFLEVQRFLIALGRHGFEATGRWNVVALFSGGIQSSYRAAIASMCAQYGPERDAKRLFEDMAAGGFEDIPKDLGYVNALFHLAIAAAELRDRARAARLYELLLPYALYNTPNTMLLYEGSASHPLARLAAVLGFEDRVEEHFETALAMNERLGAQPQIARVRYDYARWLSARREDARARAEAARAAALASELGMIWLADSAGGVAG